MRELGEGKKENFSVGAIGHETMLKNTFCWNAKGGN